AGSVLTVTTLRTSVVTAASVLTARRLGDRRSDPGTRQRDGAGGRWVMVHLWEWRTYPSGRIPADRPARPDRIGSMHDPGARREQPGGIPLRPLGLAEIMQGSLATIRKQPALLLGVAFVVVAVTGVIQIVVTRNLAFEVPSLDPEQQQ